MRFEILDKLCCPACKGKLTMESFSNEKEQPKNGGRVEAGILLCTPCKKWFPIYSYVPVMLLFPTTFHREFEKEFFQKLTEFPGYSMPNAKPEPGESFIQEAFTDEWNLMDVNHSELSFTYTREELAELHQNVWLKWAKTSSSELQTVLNVGCGLGIETIALKKALGTAEIFAIDSNLALLKSGNTFKSLEDTHIVISSLFNIPFKKESFDLVYSQGVIHHTYSTYRAFKTIGSFVRQNGYLFIWIYGLDDHLIPMGLVGAISHLKNVFEAMFRPLVCRLPRNSQERVFQILAMIAHPLVLSRVRHKRKWKLANTNHGIRDWLSPRYAHRHSYNEVLEWFENDGFRIIDAQSPRAYRNLFDKQLYGVGLTGKKLSCHEPP